jgi:hypothetical protein
VLLSVPSQGITSRIPVLPSEPTVLAEAADGHLYPVISQVFPLERPCDAHALIESRASKGKTGYISTRIPTLDRVPRVQG